MGGVLSQKAPSPQVLMLGVDNGGKSTLLNKMASEAKKELHATVVTTGFQVEGFESDDAEFKSWDVCASALHQLALYKKGSSMK
mmetsp:Transcript_6290/g.12514  ORF Transcript_6290/g.12514 Transcript_6290/m.12514 type:complete len:84 (-) Transcript_6290:174-425(-)